MALKVEDGSLVWRFDLIPTGDQVGAQTWEKPDIGIARRRRRLGVVRLDRVDAAHCSFRSAIRARTTTKRDRPGANLFTNSVIALDANSGRLKWWYQLLPNDDRDWDTTVVSLFESAGKRLLATAGKDGVLHVLDRDAGKLVFKLPVTTLLNHDVPLTPEGVRICPVAGVQWNGPAFSPRTGLLYVNAIDWCTLFKLGPDPTWVATVPYTGLANGWGENDPISSGAAGSTRWIRPPARCAGAWNRRRRCTRRSRRLQAMSCSPAIWTATSSS